MEKGLFLMQVKAHEDSPKEISFHFTSQETNEENNHEFCRNNVTYLVSDSFSKRTNTNCLIKEVSNHQPKDNLLTCKLEIDFQYGSDLSQSSCHIDAFFHQPDGSKEHVSADVIHRNIN